jgi:hypothetical protein
MAKGLVFLALMVADSWTPTTSLSSGVLRILSVEAKTSTVKPFAGVAAGLVTLMLTEPLNFAPARMEAGREVLTMVGVSPAAPPAAVMEMGAEVAPARALSAAERV